MQSESRFAHTVALMIANALQIISCRNRIAAGKRTVGRVYNSTENIEQQGFEQ